MSLLLGMFFVNVLEPGVGLKSNVDLSQDQKLRLKLKVFRLKILLNILFKSILKH
jgi:Na+/H+-dicarboxylate symporter